MRAISSASSRMRHNSPSHSRPVTASGWYPVSSSTVVSAACPSSPAESRPFLLESAIWLLSEPAGGHQPLQELVLRLVDLFLAQLGRLPALLERQQAGPDGRLVVELVRRLLLDALRQPHRPAERREGERQEPADQAHAALPALMSASAKL